MPFVLDNSVVCGWFIESQATRYSDAVADLLQEDRAWVPALWELEFTNVLRTTCLKQKLQAVQAQEIISDVLALPLGVDRRGVPPGELLALALRLGLSILRCGIPGAGSSPPVARRDTGCAPA